MEGKGNSPSIKNLEMSDWLRRKFDHEIERRLLDPSELEEVSLESDTKPSDALVLARARAEQAAKIEKARIKERCQGIGPRDITGPSM